MNWKQKIIIVGLARLTLLPEKEKYLCFVEVKYRKNEKYGAPEGAISPTKIKRICKTSQFYLWEHKLPEDTPVRYDVVFIIGVNVVL